MPEPKIYTVEMWSIRIEHPTVRGDFHHSLEELAKDIGIRGQRNPIKCAVSFNDDGSPYYEIEDGRRRVAAILLNWVEHGVQNNRHCPQVKIILTNHRDRY